MLQAEFIFERVFFMKERMKLRNVVKVKITEYGEQVDVHSVLMTSYDWQIYKFKLENGNINYRIIDSDSILIIKREKKS